MTSNIILANKSGTIQVTIFTTMVDDIYSKLITNITPAQSGGNRSNGAKDTMIVDLLRVTHRLEIDGYFTSNGDPVAKPSTYYGIGDTHSTAILKKWDLINLFKTEGTIYVTYSTGDNGASKRYEMGIEKFSIREEPEDSDTPDRYNLKLSVIEGIDRVTS